MEEGKDKTGHSGCRRVTVLDFDVTQEDGRTQLPSCSLLRTLGEWFQVTGRMEVGDHGRRGGVEGVPWTPAGIASETETRLFRTGRLML